MEDLQGESHFSQLAKKLWLKSTKKAPKVKVKPDVLKTEIWDVLEKANFAYKTLLTLENLQILERCASAPFTYLCSLLMHFAATYGLATQKIPRTSMFSSLFSSQMLGPESICQHGVRSPDRIVRAEAKTI